MHNPLLCASALCKSKATKALLLVNSSVKSNQLLCFAHVQGQKYPLKHRTKTVVGLHDHSLSAGMH